MGHRARRRGDRDVDGRPRSSRARAQEDLRSPRTRGVFSCRGCGRSNPNALAGVSEVPGSGAPRPPDPHIRAAREVRGRAGGGEPAGARRRAGPRLLRAPRFDRGDRALRSVTRDQVRDVRDGPHSRRDHRRAALPRLGAALRPHARPPDRACDSRTSRRSCTVRRRTRRSRRSSASRRRSSTTASSRSRGPRSAHSTSCGRRQAAAVTRSRSSTRSRTSPAPIRRRRSSRQK